MKLNRGSEVMQLHSQESGNLHEPAHVVGVDPVLDGPLGQLVPLIPGASVDGESQLLVLVFALLQVGHHLLGRQATHINSQQGASARHGLCRHLLFCWTPWGQHLDDVSEVLPLDVVVGFDEDLPEDGLADGVVLGVELVEAVESVSVLCGERERESGERCGAAAFLWDQRRTHGVHVQRVHAQVEGRQVHALKHLHQRLFLPLFHVHNFLRVLLHGSLDEAQKVLLVHAGGGVDVRVHLPDHRYKKLIIIIAHSPL